MKSFLSLLLICCMLAQASVRTAWVLHYQWNRAVYLKNCENRDKPNLHCDGKCYLKKKMAVSDGDNPKEPLLPEGFHQIRDIQLYFEYSSPFPALISAALPVRQAPVYIQSRPGEVPRAGIFKPPAA